MTNLNDHTNAQFVEHWRQLGSKLEKIRRRELRNFNYQKQLPIIDALLQMGVEMRVPRSTSGLVELQRRLAKAKR